MLSDEEIHDLAGEEPTPQDLCRKLVDTANERGGVDNITVVVVKLPEPGEPSAGGSGAVA
jgi:protein phosphatase